MTIDPQFQKFLSAEANRHEISRAEWEALALAIDGREMTAIAEELNVRPEAVRQRLSQVYSKFGILGKGPVKRSKLQRLLQSRFEQYQETGVIPGVETPRSPDWGDAPDVSVFYGREDELQTLKHWIVEEKCKLIGVWGFGGIGKTTVVAKLARQLDFESVIWRSLSLPCHLDTLLDGLLAHLETPKAQVAAEEQTDLPQKINRLMDCLTRKRCLLVLDRFEVVLQEGTNRHGRYKPEYEAYGMLLQKLGELPHQSCAIVLSREQTKEVKQLAHLKGSVRDWKLEGLQEQAVIDLLNDRGIHGTPEDFHRFASKYGSNPLLLKLTAATIQVTCANNLSNFLKHDTTIVNSEFVENTFAQYFQHWSALETDLETIAIKVLATTEQPMSMQQLYEAIQQQTPERIGYSQLMEAIASLSWRSLLEQSISSEQEPLFFLQPVIRKYILQHTNVVTI
jgi:NB-ARC domain